MSREKEETEPGTIQSSYSSIAQIAAHLRVPIEEVKKAKRDGCPAFRPQRINTLDFVRWMFGKVEEGEAAQNWDSRYKRARTLIDEFELARLQGKMVDRDDVAFALNKCLAAWFMDWDNMCKVQLPPVLRGLDAPAIVQKLDECSEWLKKTAKGTLAGFLKNGE